MKKVINLLLIGVLGSMLYVGGYVYSGLKYIPPHYHANFAMYINGERVDFSADRYMEDVAGCSITGDTMPKDRVHLHENNPDTIHVHSDGVSWGHFFANNNFYFDTQRIISDSEEVFSLSEENKIHFILNGKKIQNPYNRMIGSKDRLLITYGNYSETELMNLFENVSDNAEEYNNKYDPGSCGGTNENAIIVLVQDLFSLGHQH